MRVRVKLCGIRNSADLTTAIVAGVDAVGFICGVTHASEDAIDPSVARGLVSDTPPFVSTVLVTHLEDAQTILQLADYVGVDTIQIHGLVTREVVAEVYRCAGHRKITKAIHVTGVAAVEDARRYVDICDALHLDSRTDDRLGGTGKTHEWPISAQIRHEMHERRLPVILSGGLRTENVLTALDIVKPYAIDVNSGVETRNGDKDPARIAALLAITRAAGMNGVRSSGPRTGRRVVEQAHATVGTEQHPVVHDLDRAE